MSRDLHPIDTRVNDVPPEEQAAVPGAAHDTPDADDPALGHAASDRTEPWNPRREPLPRKHKLIFVGLLLCTAVVHLARIGDPTKILPSSHEQCEQVPPRGNVCYELIPLDERHYVPDARDILAFGTESDTRVADGKGESGPYVVHPPVGKWFIAAGIAVFGDRPLGWRFFGGVVGVLGVAFIYGIGLRLWRSPFAAALAMALLGVEGLWFVLSRVAMLDIYASTFLLGGVWMLFEDRDRIAPAHRGMRWWRLGAGVMIGLAIASKWSVVPLVMVATTFALAWETHKAIAALPDGRWGRRVAGLFGSLVVLPLVVYTATFTPWMLNEHRYVPPACEENEQGEPIRNRFAQLGCYHTEMVNFHRGLEKFDEEEENGETTIEGAHPYFGDAFSWPWIGRPVAHAYSEEGEGPARATSHVLGLPNPAIWVPGFLSIIALAWMSVRRDKTAWLLFSFVVAGWIPYLVADIIDRPVFLFYALPLVPFLVLGVVHVLLRARERWPWIRWGVGAYLVVAVAMFAFFYPVLAALPIPHDGWLGWEGRMWLSADCVADVPIKRWCWI